MTRLEFNNSSECLAEGKKEKVDKEEFSRFKKFMDAGKELLKKTTTWTLVGATVAFMACGPGNKTKEDAQEDTVEEVDSYEADADDDVMDLVEESEDTETVDVSVEDVETEDTSDEDVFDAVEEDTAEEADTVDDEAEEDAEEEELPPPTCPTPTGHTPPSLNTVYETNVTDSLTTSDGRISLDYDFHISMNPASSQECFFSGTGGYKFACVGDVVATDGEYYVEAGEPSFSATLDPASTETYICSASGISYPLLVYEGTTPETIRDVTYDFGGSLTVASIAGFTMSEPLGFYYDVGGTRIDVFDLSFTPTVAGTTLTYFKRDLGSVTFNSRSFDGRGSEATNSHNGDVRDASSGGFYIIAFDTGDRISYDVNVAGNYGSGWTLDICTRCSGGPRHYDLTVPLDGVNCAVNNACGCLGEPSDVRIENVTVTIEPPHFATRLTVGTALDISVVDQPTDNPSILIGFDYTGLIDPEEIRTTIELDFVVTGRSHVCSSGLPLNQTHHTIVYVLDPDESVYSVRCGCMM